MGVGGREGMGGVKRGGMSGDEGRWKMRREQWGKRRTH